MGLAFATLATWTSLARGKALEAAAGANAGPDRDVLMVQVADKFKIQTNSQIVALYIIAAFVTLAPLRQIIWPESPKATLFWVHGTFGNYHSGNGVAMLLHPRDANVDPVGVFDFPLVFPSGQANSGFTTDSSGYLPVSISVQLGPLNQGEVDEASNASGANKKVPASWDWQNHEITFTKAICLSTPPPLPSVLPPQPRQQVPSKTNQHVLKSLEAQADAVPPPASSESDSVTYNNNVGEQQQTCSDQ